MLCECCQAIFSETDPALNYDGQERKPHHKSYAAFVRAALDELCWICNIVMDDLPEDACDASPFQTFWSVAYPTYDTLFISTAKDVKILYGPPGTRTWEDVSGICTRIKLSAGKSWHLGYSIVLKKHELTQSTCFARSPRTRGPHKLATWALATASWILVYRL